MIADNETKGLVLKYYKEIKMVTKETNKLGKGLFGGDVDMTSGPLPASLITYAVPLIVTSMLQVLYTAADIAVVGNFASAVAVASIGATSAIINLLVNVFVNIATGANILLARYRGAKDFGNLKKTISTSYTFSLILGVCIMLLGMTLAEPMLLLTKCPDNVMGGALLYMRIYMIGVPAAMFYNFMSCVLRSMGDSKRPFVYLSLSGVVNIVLNLLFVIGFGMDVEGVAIATVVSQYLSAILLFIRLVRFRDENRLSPLSFKLHGDSLKKVVRYGIPSAISGASFSLSNILIASAINSFGDYAISGNTAAGYIESIFLFSITTPLMQTAATFIGQNIGAGNRERTIKIARQMYLYGGVFIAVIAALALVFDRQLLSLFIPGEDASIDFGIIGLDMRLWFAIAFAALQISNGVMQAFGYTTYQMINSLFGIVGIRFLWMLVFYPLNPTPFMLYVCYPITWCASLLGSMPVALVVLNKYRKGKNYKL